VTDAADEGAVDLDRVHGQVTQVGERGEAAAEVVDRKRDAELGHPTQSRHRDFAGGVDDGPLVGSLLAVTGPQRSGASRRSRRNAQ
jgi:hypothetical protein